MIPLNTPPGTEIVCINDELRAFATNPRVKYFGTLDGLRRGNVYTVREILPGGRHPFALVKVREITRPSGGGYAVGRFRLLDIAGLDALLNAEKEMEHL